MLSTPAHSSALLVMHYQPDVFDLVFGESRDERAARDKVIDTCNLAIRSARRQGSPVIFANFALGPDYEVVTPANRLVTALKGTGRFRTASVIPESEREATDRVYDCPRVSVFHGTSLDRDLRADGIDTLLMAGVVSSGVVLSSLAWASDADYDVHIVRDACYDPDIVAHEALFRTGFATRATIV